MATAPRVTDQDMAGPSDPPPIFLDARARLAERYLAGDGIEIGALHRPLPMPQGAAVRHLDRMTLEELRAEYPELAEAELAPVDLVGDGARLEEIADGSLDFIVANHFLQLCEDPIAMLEAHLSKLKPGGVLFYAVPDKRYTFDARRRATPLAHTIEDHERGVESSRRQHYVEWARWVVLSDEVGEDDIVDTARELEAESRSIHMHAWSQAELLELLLHCRNRFGEAFDIEAAMRHGDEMVVVLRKAGPVPEPPPMEQPSALRRLLRGSSR